MDISHKACRNDRGVSGRHFVTVAASSRPRLGQAKH